MNGQQKIPPQFESAQNAKALIGIVTEGIKEIPLTQGKVSLVDEKNYQWLSQWKWFAMKSSHGNGFYVARHAKVGGDTRHGEKPRGTG
jgi:hypothetical protein